MDFLLWCRHAVNENFTHGSTVIFVGMLMCVGPAHKSQEFQTERRQRSVTIGSTTANTSDTYQSRSNTYRMYEKLRTYLNSRLVTVTTLGRSTVFLAMGGTV